jgi:hypothetical protein
MIIEKGAPLSLATDNRRSVRNLRPAYRGAWRVGRKPYTIDALRQALLRALEDGTRLPRPGAPLRQTERVRKAYTRVASTARSRASVSGFSRKATGATA